MNELDDTQKVVRAKSIANQLRRLADAFDKDPLIMQIPEYGLVFDVWVRKKHELANFARAVGKVRKIYGDSWIEFAWEIGDDVKYRMNISREKVCERVETGEVEIVAAQPAREEYTRPKYKWVCNDPAFLPPTANEGKE